LLPIGGNCVRLTQLHPIGKFCVIEKFCGQNFRYKNFLICFARRSFNEGGAANSLFFAKKENASCLGQLANP